MALVSVAREAGCDRVLRVNGPEELPDDLGGTVGVTAGASAPEDLVDAVIAQLDPLRGVEEVAYTGEDEYFPPPRNLRDLLTAVDAAATFALGGRVAGRAGVNDRSLHASDVLADLG
jgi:4-hydroxy-3-methylbut-2-enyl diphosphate reductase